MKDSVAIVLWQFFTLLYYLKFTFLMTNMLKFMHSCSTCSKQSVHLYKL